MKKHLFQLDTLRVLATVAVVVIHVFTNETWPVNPTYPKWEWQVRELIVLSFRWVVPVFVMLSGALMLGSEKHESYGDFLKKRFSRVGIPLVAWAVIYYFFFNAIGQVRTVEQQIQLTVVGGYPAYHLYFVYIVGGLYCITPLLKKFFIPLSLTRKWVIALTLLNVSSVWAMHLLWVSQDWHFSGLYSWSFFLPFIGYYILGHLLVQAKWNKNLAFGGFLLSTSLLYWGSYFVKSAYGYSPRGLIFHDYFNPLVVISASCLLVWVMGSKTAERLGATRWIQSISATSFGIYLLHWIMMYYVKWLILDNSITHLSIIFVLTFIISYLSVRLINLIPRLGIVMGSE